VTEVRVQYLGHATVLVELAGFRILTDPFLRGRLGPLRRHGPVPGPGGIGPVDVVLISHAHPDHFDPASVASIGGDPLVIVPRGLGSAVRRLGRRAREVGVGETVGVAADRSVLSVPARHWRWPGEPRAATIGYLVEGPEGGIYFAGDTSRFSGMRAFADRVDLALLPVASWGPHLTPGHLGPRSAAEVARDLRARYAVPIHWGTLYPAGLERLLPGRLRQPASRFAGWLEQISPATEARILQPGDSTGIPL
jgi:L-ascorbate metabolism protein UlaG (beta-lactamase superfamily)